MEIMAKRPRVSDARGRFFHPAGAIEPPVLFHIGEDAKVNLN
jgi:hypothetical protein